MVQWFLTNMPMQLNSERVFLTNNAKAIGSVCKKKKLILDLYLKPYIIINSKTFDRPMYKSSDDNTYKEIPNMSVILYWQSFLNGTQKAWLIKMIIQFQNQTFSLQKALFRNWKDKSQTVMKYIQGISVKNLHLEYIMNS